MRAKKCNITKKECAMIRKLQQRGFAVIVWNPDELNGIDSTDIEDHSISKGWEYIEMFGGGIKVNAQAKSVQRRGVRITE